MLGMIYESIKDFEKAKIYFKKATNLGNESVTFSLDK
jgi:hypothetical protein